MLSLVEPDEAKPFRRGARGTAVLAVFERPEHPEPIEESLARRLPDVAARARESRPRLRARRGRGSRRWSAAISRRDPEEELAKNVIERLVPLACPRLIIDNEFKTDLEPELWEGDEITESIRDAGVRLGAQPPAEPFPSRTCSPSASCGM